MLNDLLVFLLTCVVQVIMLIMPMDRMRRSAMQFTMMENDTLEKCNHLYTSALILRRNFQ